MSTWFITGASRGFGLELVKAALAAGDHVVAAARNPQELEATLPDASDALLVVPLDVTDEAQARAAVDAAVTRFDHVDVLVNNAGFGLFGSIEEITDDQARAIFDTNVFGLLNVTRAILPVMRGQSTGHVVNIGSSAGVAVGAGRGIYGATKFAVEAITEAMHAELAPLGIHVTVVEPGSFRTDFLTDSRREAAVTMSAYADTVGALLGAIAANDGRQPGDPVKAVAAIRRLVTDGEPPLRLPLGSDTVVLTETKIADLTRSLRQWRDVARSTDFEPP